MPTPKQPSLTTSLQKEAASLWEKTVTHPFVLELGDGVLPWDKFQRYFQQDHLFLRDWIYLLTLGAAKAPDFHHARPLVAFLHSVLGGEDKLFQDAFDKMGLTSDQVRALEPLPTTRAFGDYLKNIALQGGFPDILTALLCAEWLYVDWSQRLVKHSTDLDKSLPPLRGKARMGGRRRGDGGSLPSNPFYRQWIEIHAGDELADFVNWMRRALDSAPDPNIPRLRCIFRDTLRYEYLFFQMAYHGESWPD
jgi:thiaminase/transcriptional activator TenA